MVPTERLFELAGRVGVDVEFFPFAAPLLGFYFMEPPLPPTIGLHTQLLGHEALLRCVLAEELGHRFTSSGDQVAMPYRSYLGRVLLNRAEKRAMAWAAGLLMPPVEVVDELRQGAGVEDLAQEFYVTPTFVRAGMQLPRYVIALRRSSPAHGEGQA